MHNLRAKCIGKNFKLIVIVRQGRRGDGAMGWIPGRLWEFESSISQRDEQRRRNAEGGGQTSVSIISLTH